MIAMKMNYPILLFYQFYIFVGDSNNTLRMPIARPNPLLQSNQCYFNQNDSRCMYTY